MKSEPKAFASLSSGLLARKGAARPAMRPQGFGQAGGSLEDLGWNDMGHEAQRPALIPLPVAEEEALAPPLSRTPLAGLTPASPVHHQQAEIEERFGYPDEETEESVEAGGNVPISFVSFVVQDEEADQEETASDEDEALELADCLPEAMPEPTIPFVEEPSVATVSSMVDEPAVRAPKPAAAPKRARQARADPAAKDKAAFTLRLDPSRHLKLRLACAVNAKSAQQLVTTALDELLSSMPELDAMASQAPGRANRKA